MDLIVAGFGTVGQGFAEVISMRREMLMERFSEEVRIVAAFDSRSYAHSPNGLDPLELVHRKQATGRVGENELKDPLELLRTVDHELLVEVSPTDIESGGRGLEYIRASLSNGKHVITCNKGPLALRFRELDELAKRNGVALRFEGSVGGAMPIVNLASDLLMGEEIHSIQGILNGTCNFILSRMDDGLPFHQALTEAQEMGYAEADPTYDIEGIDSAAKVAILANAIFGIDATFSDVRRVGITGVTEEAIALAAEEGQVIRLIGEVSKDRLEVSPRLVPKGHPLSIRGTLNMALLKTDLAGPITVSGRGAGRMETASALLSDLITVLRDNAKSK